MTDASLKFRLETIDLSIDKLYKRLKKLIEERGNLLVEKHKRRERKKNGKHSNL